MHPLRSPIRLVSRSCWRARGSATSPSWRRSKRSCSTRSISTGVESRPGVAASASSTSSSDTPSAGRSGTRWQRAWPGSNPGTSRAQGGSAHRSRTQRRRVMPARGGRHGEPRRGEDGIGGLATQPATYVPRLSPGIHISAGHERVDGDSPSADRSRRCSTGRQSPTGRAGRGDRWPNSSGASAAPGTPGDASRSLIVTVSVAMRFRQRLQGTGMRIAAAPPASSTSGRLPEAY